MIDALVHGSGYERIATAACSDRTIRRRLKKWAKAVVAQRVHALALAAYDRIIGPELNDLPVDGCITKAPCGGDKAGPSPVDSAQGRPETLGGLRGLRHPARNRLRRRAPARLPAAGPDLRRRPNPGRNPARPGHQHLDAGYDSGVTRELLAELGFEGEISRKGVPAPIQVGKRWVVERTHAWMNGYGKLRRCTDKDGEILDFWLYLAAAFVTVRQLIQRARNRYRWDTRPTLRRLR